MTLKLPQIYTANHVTFPIRIRKLQYRFAVTSGSPSIYSLEQVVAVCGDIMGPTHFLINFRNYRVHAKNIPAEDLDP